MRLATTLLACLITVAAASCEELSPPRLPPDAQAALRKNASMFSNILITGERERRLLVPYETVKKNFQTLEREPDFTKTLYFELRFRGPSFRESTKHPPGNTYTHDVVHETSFDGTQYRLGNKSLISPPNSHTTISTPSIAIEQAKRDERVDAPARVEFWYLRETGFSGPQKLSTLGQTVASTILDAAEKDQIVSISEIADGDETLLEVVIEQPEPWLSTETFDIDTHESFLTLLNGSDKLQMRMERERRELAGKSRVIRFLLNKALGYAVQEKWESRQGTDGTMYHTTNSDFVQVSADGVWMPKRCVVQSHVYYTAPLYISPDPLFDTVLLIDQIVPGNFDDDEFRVWYDVPGAMVSDWTSPKATAEEPELYRVPASLSDLVGETSGARRWLIALNILAIAGLLGWLWQRKRGMGN